MVSRMYVSLFLFSLISPFFVTCFSIGSSLNGGKHCSLFDFEEKVLEKLVRIEHAMEINKNKMELWERDINNKIKLLDEDNDKRKSETRMMKNDIQTELENQKSVLEDIVNDYKTVLTSIVENSTVSFENVTRDFVEESGVLLTDIKEKETQWNETSRKMKQMFNQTLQSVNRQAEIERVNQQKLTSKNLKDLHQNFTLFQQELIQPQSQTNQTMFEYIQQTMTAASGNNKVAVKMCAQRSTKSYPSNTIIPFKDIKTMNGISGTGRSNIETTGKFTCETTGLYVISVFILTKTHDSCVALYKNSDGIGYIYFSLNGYYQTNSVTVVENLTVNDSIYVKARTEIFVYEGGNSCMSVIQIN